jgi:hypothetical protein
MPMTFGQQTPEQRAENIAKARLARAQQFAHNKAHEHLLKLDYMDSNHWANLASKHKVRMPASNEPCTPKGMRKYLKRVGITNEQWKDAYTSIDYFIEHNPKWTLYAAAGCMLEMKEGM